MKKFIIILILSLPAFTLRMEGQVVEGRCYGQMVEEYVNEPVESSIFFEVEKYRHSKSLKDILFDYEIYLAAERHTKYCIKVKDIFHEEDIDVPNHTELTTLTERMRKTEEGNDVYIIARYENLAVLSPYNTDGSIRTPEEIGKRVIMLWDASPSHNDILNKKGKSNEFFVGAVSVEKSYNYKDNPILNLPYIYVTFNYVKYVYNNN